MNFLENTLCFTSSNDNGNPDTQGIRQVGILDSVCFKLTMSPEELDSLIQEIECNLKKDLILESGFDSYSLGRVNKWQRGKTFILKIFFIFNAFRFILMSWSTFFPLGETSKYIRMVGVDILYAFGLLGGLMSHDFFLGSLLAISLLSVITKHERKNQLHFISHVKHHERYKFTSEERQKFATFLLLMKWQRKVAFITCALPMFLYQVIGAVMTANELNSSWFTAASIPMVINYFLFNTFITSVITNVLLMACHSSNYLSIRFNRLFLRMDNLNRKTNMSLNKPDECLIKDWATKARNKVNNRHLILQDTQTILDEIAIHDQTVKHIIASSTRCVGPAIGFATIFSQGTKQNIYSVFVLSAIVFFTVFYQFMLFKVCQVYSFTRELNRRLHGMQVRTPYKKLLILRLVQRTSDCKTWDNCIGFTLGGETSFTQFEAIMSVSDSISLALTFMNAVI